MYTSLDLALGEIEHALNVRLYYLALISTLSLIDICAALESENGRSDKHAYIAWYDRHLSAQYSWLTGQDCYGIRCGMLHQGVMDQSVRNMPRSRWDRIGFLLPDGNGNEFRQLAANNYYFTGLSEFCRDVSARVRTWSEAEKDNPVVKKNAANLMRFHPRGIKPYIDGIAVFS